MNSDHVKHLIEQVKENPNSYQNWQQLAQQASCEEDWKTSFSAYLAMTTLFSASEEIFQQLEHSKQSFISQCDMKEQFQFETFVLPKKTVVVLLLGMLNMEVENVDHTVTRFIEKNWHFIIVDFGGLEYLSGLGPSCLRKWCSLAQQKPHLKIVFSDVNQSVQDTLTLKKISPDLCHSLREAVQTIKVENS